MTAFRILVAIALLGLIGWLGWGAWLVGRDLQRCWKMDKFRRHDRRWMARWKTNRSTT